MYYAITSLCPIPVFSSGAICVPHSPFYPFAADTPAASPRRRMRRLANLHPIDPPWPLARNFHSARPGATIRTILSETPWRIDFDPTITASACWFERRGDELASVEDWRRQNSKLMPYHLGQSHFLLGFWMFTIYYRCVRHIAVVLA